jgi:hypothetical protein
MRIYALTIFVGAFLLFQIEPMIAKYLLPWFGGTAMVWTTCLLFFQTLLLAGYTYAHLIGTKLAPRHQFIIHLGLIGICVTAMLLLALLSNSPVMPSGSWKSAHPAFPVLRILLVLGASVGLPYFVLSTTAPLLQSWFARIYPGASVYRLYALSNLGSLLALLTYPFVVEPRLALRTQANLWALLYGTFAIGMLLCALPLRNREAPPRAPMDESLEPDLGTKALWIALAACASVLLYGATGQMTQDVAPIPFLWILPLALYLLSFIICFDGDRWYRRGIFHPLLGMAIFASFLVVIYLNAIAPVIGRAILSPQIVALAIEVGNLSLLLFAGCMVCHGELVRLRPHRRDLTVFYLLVSAGGVLGGVLSVVVAPLLFRGFWDFRFAVWASVGLMTVALVRDRQSWIYRRPAAVGIAILAVALGYPLLIRVVEHVRIYSAVVLTVIAAVALLTRWKNRPRWLARPGLVLQLSMLAVIAVLGFIYFETIEVALHDTLWIARNFYGVFRVVENEGPNHQWRSYRLLNGRISHGMQVYSASDPQTRYYPATYYDLDSGIGLIMMNHPRRTQDGNSSLRVGIVGLGVGTIAAWGRPGDHFSFYEVNPAIIKLASDPNGYFSYLRDSSAKVVIVPGDARLSMERELAEGRSQQFDVLVIDAFNGDSIPTHLLTRQAMLVYLAELAPDGVLAVHVSNLFLDLRPVLAENSRDLNLRYGFVSCEEKDAMNWASDWVLLARNDKVLGQPEIASRLKSRDGLRRVRPWTDDYSNLFQLLK